MNTPEQIRKSTHSYLPDRVELVLAEVDRVDAEAGCARLPRPDRDLGWARSGSVPAWGGPRVGL
ncbi:MAG: hypothetical protein Q4P07_00080 [Ornithinimicrobium sp.]|uniref:hypothetical protein n=1 Tax=Ornithinimicrobium sp. TaxID=1977084 RepID=UPI0026DF4E45|nr:hypothetical protein [Ornithinimicrobium sp.]MDO5738526.1 hypothetical protein [Ornithinimicrobium sp.]